jgi:hypothetical protein
MTKKERRKKETKQKQTKQKKNIGSILFSG